MRYYKYNEQRDGVDELIVKSEAEILNEYWDKWSEKMERMYGPGHAVITPDNCIADWVIEHWAWEAEEGFGDVPNEVILNIDEDVITWGNTVVGYLESETEQWFPVLGFRWLEKHRASGVELELQQQFLSNTGKEEWRKIPTVVQKENDE